MTVFQLSNHMHICGVQFISTQYLPLVFVTCDDDNDNQQQKGNAGTDTDNHHALWKTLIGTSILCVNYIEN